MAEFLHCGHSLLILLISIGTSSGNFISTKETRSNYICNFSKIKHYKQSDSTLFVIPLTTRSFIDSLVDYYISEAASYKQMSKTYSDKAEDIPATTFGLIVGSIYSAFLQTYDNQKQKPPLEDIQEFMQIIKQKSVQIKKSILEAKT